VFILVLVFGGLKNVCVRGNVQELVHDGCTAPKQNTLKTAFNKHSAQ
jgi:hypothetical protein